MSRSRSNAGHGNPFLFDFCAKAVDKQGKLCYDNSRPAWRDTEVVITERS